jgi:hypothetical protein
MTISSGNSIVPTDREHDDHYAHRCLDCAQAFGRLHPVAEETKDGDICEDCAAKREIEREVESE